MLEAAVKALTQMTSLPFRSVLYKSAGVALLLLVAIGYGLHRLFAWLSGAGAAWLEGSLGLGPSLIAAVLWVVAILAGLGLIAGAVFLMPAVTSLVASLFGDAIAEEVERVHYPADPPGTPLPIARALVEGVRTALLALAVYLGAAPFLLLAGLGFVIFFVATAYLLGREYFLLAAMRFHPVTEARELRRRHHSMVFIGGLFIAAFVSIPIVNFATPLFATAFMVHVYKRLGAVPSLVSQNALSKKNS